MEDIDFGLDEIDFSTVPLEGCPKGSGMLTGWDAIAFAKEHDLLLGRYQAEEDLTVAEAEFLAEEDPTQIYLLV